jgi:peptidoglycan/LPS O-acetylase OafA/YrhL
VSNTVIQGEGLSKAPPLHLSARIPELDGIRGIAIGMVLIFHYFQGALIARPGSLPAYLQAAARLSWSGVDLFFVLSGFLIGGILLDARKATNYFQVFYTRRFFRIVPIYFAVLLALPALISVGQWSHPGNFAWFRLGDPLPWYSYWTFTQNFWMAHVGSLGSDGLSMTWSLAVEEQFYLTLPLFLRLMSPRWFIRGVLLAICTAPLLRMALHLFWPHNWIPSSVLMPCRADALLLGVLAAILMRNVRWRERMRCSNLFFPISLSVFSLGIAFLTLKPPNGNGSLMVTVGFTWLALSYTVFLLFALTHPNSLVSRVLRLKGLGWLGAIAYGTYLLHQPVQGLLFGYFRGEAPAITGGYTLLTTLLALLLTLVIARLSWRFFELPLMRVGHRSRYEFANAETGHRICG